MSTLPCCNGRPRPCLSSAISTRGKRSHRLDTLHSLPGPVWSYSSACLDTLPSVELRSPIGASSSHLLSVAGKCLGSGGGRIRKSCKERQQEEEERVSTIKR